MKNLQNLCFIAAIIATLILPAGVFAQAVDRKGKIQTELVIFETINDYTPPVGSATLKLDHAQFEKRLAKEVNANQSKVVRRMNFISVLGTENRVGSEADFYIEDDRNRYRTSYKENLLLLTPNLVGGYTDETSNLVTGSFFFQTARLGKKLTKGLLPSPERVSIDTTLSQRLNVVVVFSGGAKNENGTFTYAALRFTR